ncbi:peptidoglycan-binding protein [Streptomyces sp. NPDC093795]|uniref:peptidoglycan-binding domain-containing protein n=1 Tax=Streptomyces sp. NPDC093795 TaxID=3366051 RepID=UPI0037F7A20E
MTLDSPGDSSGDSSGGGISSYGDGSSYRSGSSYGDGSAYGDDDPPTARLAAIRPVEGADTAPGPGAYGAESFPGEPHTGGHHPAGDPSETMPLLLRGVGDVPPPLAQEGGRGRRRGMVVAAVAAVAVAGTAALAAAVLGGSEVEDRAAVPEVTTSASLNIAVSEEPSPSSSSASPEPTSSSPTPRRTSASPTPTPSASRTTASPSAAASTAGAAAPPAASPSAAPTTASPTTAPVTTAPPAASPEDGDEEEATLSVGSTGPEVRELQRRLSAVYAYRGRIDGKYDDDVREAVAEYQDWKYIRSDPEGVYGPDTRRALEGETSGS